MLDNSARLTWNNVNGQNLRNITVGHSVKKLECFDVL